MKFMFSGIFKLGISICLITVFMEFCHLDLQKSWSVSQTGNIIEISFGSKVDSPQYAALHLESGYFRMNFGPSSGWGTSVILLPSFWEEGIYYHGAPITATWKVDDSDLVIFIQGIVSKLQVQGEIRLSPPGQDSISATVAIHIDGNAVLDYRPGEAFKPMMLSSMRISTTIWDSQSAYVDSQLFEIPVEGWIIKPPAVGRVLGLQGGTSEWKLNAPTVEAVFGQNINVSGWVTRSNNPNDDNVGFWVTTDQLIPSWQYSIKVKK